MSPALSIHLLGPLLIEAGGSAVSLRYNKARALLAYLALERGFHTRDALSFLLWPEASLQTGRERLKRMLFQLKTAFGPELLEGNRDVLRLRTEAGVWTDVAAFSEVIDVTHREARAGIHVDFDGIAAAARLYRGQFLQGLELDDAPDFANWVQLHREKYRKSFLHVVRLLAEAHEREGALFAAIERARQLTSEAPLEDEYWRYLLELLVKAGQRERALQEFEHYRRLLSVELGTQPSESVRRVLDTASAAQTVEAKVGRAAERRQLTAVACEFDAAGEPEDIVAAMAGHIAGFEAILRQASAHVVRTPSGGLLAYFGYPHAMEGAARRAVVAAQACLRDVAAQSDTAARGVAVESYVGVHTGVVLSSPQGDVPDASGVVSRLAIQLSSLAGRDDILISEATRHLLGDAIAVEFAGRLHGRSQDRDIDIFHIRRAMDGGGRSRCETFFRGRHHELARLREVWLDDSRPAYILLGEAGLGKSCLLEHFLHAERIESIVFKCASELRQMPFHPFARWIETLQSCNRSIAGGDDDAFAHCLARAEQMMHLSRTDAVTAIPALNARESLVRELYRLIGLCVPVGGVVAFDDAHWADPSTREVLALLIEKPLPHRSVFVTARPDFVPPWRRTAHVARLDLQPLGESDVLALIHAVAGDRPLPEGVRQQIAALSEGVPLYAEELTRDVLDKGRNRAGDPRRQSHDVGELLPRSLNDLLMSRIDSVGNVKPIAQFAASAGGEFTLELLEAAMGEPRAELAEAIAVLLRHNLVVPLDDKRYMFRHALLREAAYQSQAKSARLDAHRRLAEVLARDPHTYRHTPEALAWHYLRAGDRRRAIDYLLLAGRNAASKSAYREAAGYYRSALDIFTPTSDAAVVMEELTVRMELGIQLCALHGCGSPDTVDTFREALALAQPLGNDPRLFPVYWGLWNSASSWADYGMSVELSKTLLRLAQVSDDPALLCYAHYARGYTALFQGHFDDAVQELETGAGLYRPGSGNVALGEDSLTVTLGTLGLAYWYAGRFDDAVVAATASIEHARRIGHRYSLANALVSAAAMYRLGSDVDKVEQLCTEASQVAQELGTPLWAELVETFQSWAMAARGDVAGIPRVSASVQKIAGIMNGLAPFMMAQWAEACDLVDDSRAGLEAVERGLATAAEIQDHHNESEFQRLKGKFLCSQGQPVSAYRPWLETALRSAQKTGSPVLILRAALSLIGHADEAPSPAQLDLLRTCLGAVQGGGQLWEVRCAYKLMKLHASDASRAARTC